MRKPRSVALKLGIVGGLLLLAVLSSMAVTLSLSWRLEGGAGAVNEAGRLRMQAWRLVHAIDSGDRRLAAAWTAEFDRSLQMLASGDPSRPLFVPRDERSQASLAAVNREWASLRGHWAEARPVAGSAAAEAEHFVAAVDACVDAIELQLSRLTAILHGVQFALVALVVAGALAALYSAHLLVFTPLQRLQAGLARVGSGDLAARVDVAANDEFGALSRGFNEMALTLSNVYRNLEATVRSKTADLEAERKRLAALYEAVACAANAADLNQLAQGFAAQLRRQAGADGVAVRWSDEANRRYLMLAADGLPPEMVEAEHCVSAGQCLCGQPRAPEAVRVIPIARRDGEAALGHCRRAGYETMVAIPVRLHDRTVGELNLFYRDAVALSDDDRTLYATMANHLATAIESLRVEALRREAAVAEERGLLARELHDSIAQSLAFLKIQVGILRDAAERRDAVRSARTIDELDAGVRESLSDVRELLLHFRTRTNGEDIAPALQTTLRKFEHQTGLATTLAIEGDALPLPPDVQVQVLHVVQEALSNVRKHAGARHVWVDVHQGPCWRVAVRDDGCGLDTGAIADETQVGLRIMRERAARIGATVEVASQPGGGTQVALLLPAQERIAA